MKSVVYFLAVFLFFTFAEWTNGESHIGRNVEEKLPSLLKSEVDSDFDGTIDQWVYYDKDGSMMKAEFDTNKDSKIDHWEYYGRKGIVERVELDSDFNGQIDQWVFF